MDSCNQRVIKGTTAMWAAADNVLPLGTFCIEILSNNKIALRVGDGVRKYSQLPAYSNDEAFSEVITWESGAAYSANTLVAYNGDIYASKVDIVASPVFDPSQWNILTSVALAAEVASKLGRGEATHDLMDNMSVQVSPTSVMLKKQTYNLGTATTGESSVSLPLADSANAGVMPPTAFNQLNQNTSRIAALEGRITVFLVSFAGFADSANPTDAELTAAYKTAAGVATEPFDGVTIVEAEDVANVYRFYTSAGVWKKNATGNIYIAQNGTLGLVQGEDANGKIFVEPDGTMSLKGYDDIIEGKTYSAAGLTTLDIETGQLSEKTLATTHTDNYGGFQASKTILDLKVSKAGVEQNIGGLAVNGKRIDFDQKSLVIRTKGEDAFYNLTNGPYTVTSANACVEMYGRLFIFDEAVPGKGIIRNADGTISEVTNLGIYCPSSSVNVIHVFDPDDKDVCYIINESTQSITLCVYPDGTYKTCNFGAVGRTPQNISNIELLTSVNGKRHSYYMRESHALNTGTNTALTEHILFQLEDCTFKIIDATTKACDGGSETFVPGANFGDYRIFWEGHTDIDDIVPNSKNSLDMFYADNKNLNRRFPFKTGQWQSEAGSVRRNKRMRAQHNGLYTFSKGAQILWGHFNTNLQAMLITPEGFIGWFECKDSLAKWYNKDFREFEIEKGPYKGKRGIILYSIDGGIKNMVIVNTYDDDPNHTVCTGLHTNTTNLHHVSGKNVIAANFVLKPNMVYTDGIRVYLGQDTTAVAASKRYFVYFNLSELAPNTYNAATNTWTRNFDCHCIDSLIDTTLTTLIFECNAWNTTYHCDFGTGSDGGTGTLVKGSGTVSMFLPLQEDTWDGASGIRPHFVRHPGDLNLYTAGIGYGTTGVSYWRSPFRIAVNWNNHHIQTIVATTPVAVTQALDFYYNAATKKMVCRAITFASGNIHLPVVIDSKHMLLWPSNGTARCVALTWSTATKDYTVTDGGAWLPPRTTSAHLTYVKYPSEAEAAAGVKAKVYFFDMGMGTARTDYLRLTYTEDANGNSVPAYTTFALPKSMICGRIIAYPNDKILLTVGAADTAAYYFTIEMSSSIAVTYPDSGIIQDIFDITNTMNPNETADGAYLVIQGDEAFFYVLERDSQTGVPTFTRYAKRLGVSRRLWALPNGSSGGVPTLRFALGSNIAAVSTVSSPVSIIERVGGTINASNANPINYTLVRDFGTDANAAARADLAVPAKVWGEPHLIPGTTDVVRFMSTKTQHDGDAWSQHGDVSLLGYKNGVPVYGEAHYVKTGLSHYSADLANNDQYWFEVGPTKDKDGMITTPTAFGVAYRMQDQWEAFPVDTEYAVGNKFRGGNKCRVWLCGQITDNYYGTTMDSMLIVGEVVSTTVASRVVGQYVQMGVFNLKAAVLAGGALTTMSSQGGFGFAYDFRFRKHRIFKRDLSREQNVANWSLNEAPTVIDMTSNLPYATLAAADYGVARGASVVPVMQTTARIPMYAMFENQILPGIYARRNNQVVPNYPGAESNIVPFFEFTDNKCSMVFRNMDNTAMSGIVAFTGQVRVAPQRQGLDANTVFMSREIYDPSSGDAIVMCFYVEGGVSKYKDIVMPKAKEFIKQVVHRNATMEFSGPTKKWVLDLAAGTVSLASTPPYSVAALTFDKGVDLASIRPDNGYKLYIYLPQNLIIEYQGQQYWSIPLADLVLRGQTVAEALTVTNGLRANTIEASTILLQSKYPKVSY